MTVVVASFNIRTGWAFDGMHSWPLRRGATARAIRELDADIIGLQEVHAFQQHYLERALPAYRWTGQGRGRHGRGERCPILVRRGRFDVLRSRTWWFGIDPSHRGARLPGASAPRIATLALVRDLDLAGEFEVINTHLDEHVPENRLRSASQLASWVSGHVPAVVVGDFNAESDDSLFSPLHDAGLRHALPGDTGTSAHQWSGGSSLDHPRIDHILVSECWAVECARVQADPAFAPLPSDHWPVVATLRLLRRR